MSYEGATDSNEFEKKRQEFFDRVDAGDFDDVIKARHTHKVDQLSEQVERFHNPRTPDELIAAAQQQVEMDDAEKMTLDEPLSPEDQKKLDNVAVNFLDFVNESNKKGKLWALRDIFKRDSKNLERYIEGKL